MYFLKLTQKGTNQPVWIVFAHIVSVLAEQNGGSQIITSVEGMRYTVTESPDEIFAMVKRGGQT